MHTQAKMVALVLAVIAGLIVAEPSWAKEPDSEAITQLVKLLGSEDFKERQDAYKKLINVGPPVLPRLREAMKSEDLEVAGRASTCIEEIGRTWHREYLENVLGLKDLSLAQVLRLTQDERAYVRHSATHLLYKWKNDPEAVAALLRRFRDEHVVVRRMAAGIALNFVAHEEVLRALIAALKDEDEVETNSESSISNLAADSLGGMDRPTPEVWAALVETAKTGNDGARCGALLSIGRLASRNEDLAPEAVTVLVAALKGKDYVKKQCGMGLRACAAGALCHVQVKAKAAVPDLIEALRAEGAEDAQTAEIIRRKVLYAFQEIGPDAAAAVPAIMEIAKKKDISRFEQGAALGALKRIDPGLKLPDPLPPPRKR